ncbi:retrovirus-related pol polyprotein from transposon TNT 1-94 [Tanacetum coccineum]
MSDEQAFRLQSLHPNTDQSASSPVKIEAPRELPKVILVNTSLKKLKYHLGQNDNVVKKRITPDALTERGMGDIVNIVVNSSLYINTSVNVNSSVAMNDYVNYVEMRNKCVKLEAELIKQRNIVEKDEYNRLSKSFSKHKQHCISLELAIQLNEEILQKNNTSVNQTEPLFDQLFELNNLKTELQAKDTTIKKLKAKIKRLNKTSTINSVKKDIDEIETINIELEHRERVFVITTLKNDLRKFKGKDIVDNAAQASNATTIAPGMYNLDLVTLAPKDKNNRETHIYYLKHTMKQAAILREIVEQSKSIDSASYYAYKITATNKVPLRDPIPLKVVAQESIVTKVYTRRPKVSKTNSSNSKPKIAKYVVQIVLWYLDSGCSKHMTRDHSQLTNFAHRFLSNVKFDNDHIAKIMGKKQSHKPKSKDTNQEKLYLLHMDLYGLMRVASVNGKKYILVIVDEYSRFTWVKFLASNDEAPDFIIEFMKMIQVGISRETSVAQTPQQNGVVERQNHTLVEAARTRLIFAQAPLFLWDEAIATACFAQSRSIIRQRHGKTPYELLHDRKLDLSYLHFNPPTIAVSPSTSIPSTQDQEHSLIISQGLEESPKTPHFHDDLLHESLHEDSTSQGLSSNMKPIHTLFESLGRWTKDHPIENVIEDPSRSASTRKQLHTDAMSFYFDSFLTFVEPKNFKQAMIEPSWINAIQEEIHEFKRLQVWELVSCPDKVMLIKLKWIYKVKTDEFGEESFAPVSRIEAILSLLQIQPTRI